MTTIRPFVATTGAVLAMGLALSACGASSDPTKSPAASGSAGSAGAVTSVVVGAADFSESQVLAEIYAQALSAKGITASTRPNIGSRDVYLKAVEDGSVDLVPESTCLLYTSRCV